MHSAMPAKCRFIPPSIDPGYIYSVGDDADDVWRGEARGQPRVGGRGAGEGATAVGGRAAGGGGHTGRTLPRYPFGALLTPVRFSTDTTTGRSFECKRRNCVCAECFFLAPTTRAFKKNYTMDA